MDIYASLVGIVVVVYIIYKFRKTKLEKTKWAYTLLLASFPAYYFVFALYARDLSAFKMEVLIGLIFFCISICAYQSKQTQLYFAVGIGCLLHAFYDFYHDAFILNAGVPAWWPVFCGTVDLILGVYLIYMMVVEHNKILILGYEKN